MPDPTSKMTAANGLVIAAKEGGVLSLYPLPGGRKGIGIFLPNGITVNLDLIAVAQIHQFFGAWLEGIVKESAENAG